MTLATLSAAEAARGIASGELRSEELVRDCLERMETREEAVRAWVHLDAEYALEQARQADALRQSGASLGPLHGVPVGIKDIIDTRDMPTQHGTPLSDGRQVNEDASVVSLLRQAGAVIMGKTVTTELAVYAPNETRNPHDPERTPGGSSSGSAAAVAAEMVPLALGTQTNGSVIRPASYCGVVGYKPSHGRISRHGVLLQSRCLDHVGVLARSVTDAALAVDAMSAYDARDPDMRAGSLGALSAVAASEPPLTPVLAFVKSPVWEQADATTQAAFGELVEFLGEGCDEVTLPEVFARAVDCQRTVHVADLAKNYAGFYQRGKDRLSEVLRGMIEEGQTVRAVDYNLALEWREVMNAGLEEVFERYDAIVTPATTGEAPLGLDSTGSPIFCSLWTFTGVPAVSLPLLEGENGMPIGVQVVGRRGDDARLLRTARWLSESAEPGEAMEPSTT